MLVWGGDILMKDYDKEVRSILRDDFYGRDSKLYIQCWDLLLFKDLLADCNSSDFLLILGYACNCISNIIQYLTLFDITYNKGSNYGGHVLDFVLSVDNYGCGKEYFQEIERRAIPFQERNPEMLGGYYKSSGHDWYNNRYASTDTTNYHDQRKCSNISKAYKISDTITNLCKDVCDMLLCYIEEFDDSIDYNKVIGIGHKDDLRNGLKNENLTFKDFYTYLLNLYKKFLNLGGVKEIIIKSALSVRNLVVRELAYNKEVIGYRITTEGLKEEYMYFDYKPVRRYDIGIDVEKSLMPILVKHTLKGRKLLKGKEIYLKDIGHDRKVSDYDERFILEVATVDKLKNFFTKAYELKGLVMVKDIAKKGYMNTFNSIYPSSYLKLERCKKELEKLLKEGRSDQECIEVMNERVREFYLTKIVKDVPKFVENVRNSVISDCSKSLTMIVSKNKSKYSLRELRDKLLLKGFPLGIVYDCIFDYFKDYHL